MQEKWPENITHHTSDCINCSRLYSIISAYACGIVLLVSRIRCSTSHSMDVWFWHFAIHEQDKLQLFLDDRNRQSDGLIASIYTYVQLSFFAEWITQYDDDFNGLRWLRRVSETKIHTHHRNEQQHKMKLTVECNCFESINSAISLVTTDYIVRIRLNNVLNGALMSIAICRSIHSKYNQFLMFIHWQNTVAFSLFLLFFSFIFIYKCNNWELSDIKKNGGRQQYIKLQSIE